MELRSTIRLVSDGTVEWVDLTFEIHPEDDLHVYFDGDRVEQGWTLMQESTPQRVVFDEPIPDGVDVIIRRASDLSEIPHVFHYTGNIKGGAEFNAKNMDENFSKILRASEDAMDSFELVGVNVEAAVDAGKSAAEAEASANLAADQAALALQRANAALNSANSAAGSADTANTHANRAEDAYDAVAASASAAADAADAAATSESNAKDSEIIAQGHASGAATSASNALSYKQDAETAKNQAQTHRDSARDARDGAQAARDTALQHQQAAGTDKDEAANSATQAGISATEAENHKDLAYRWANAPEDQPVEQGEFSAYHWAKKAEGFVGGSEFLHVSNNLSEVDPEVARDNLGLGSAATRDVVSSNTDTSGGGKVITQGWMGLGGKSKGIQIPSSGSDLNDYQHTGFYSQSMDVGATDGSNYPENSAGCLLVYPTAGNGGVGQTYYTYLGKMYIRYFERGSWGPWQEIHHTGNILKTTGNNNNYPMSQKAVTDALNNLPTPEGIPSGLISMWSGALNAIPSGWALCDGSNGTPNLTDRFIVAAGGDYAVGDTGDGSIPSHSHGSGSLTAASSGAHTHTASTGSAGSHSHSGSANSTGAHTHTIQSYQSLDSEGTRTLLMRNPIANPSFQNRSGVRAASSGAHTHSLSINSNGAHTHTVSVASGGAHTHSVSGTTAESGSGTAVIAKYYALAYIMKL